MNAKTITNFLGIPVEGDITPADKRVPQRPLADLEPLLRAVLDDDGMASFGWTQYTPYFNDGDPCVFSVGEPWFRTTADGGNDDEGEDEDEEDDDEDDDRFELSGHPTLATECWNSSARGWVTVERDAETIARHDRAKALAEAIGSGAFDDVLLDAFGDHARVTVRRSGITVDEYSHE